MEWNGHLQEQEQEQQQQQLVLLKTGEKEVSLLFDRCDRRWCFFTGWPATKAPHRPKHDGYISIFPLDIFFYSSTSPPFLGSAGIFQQIRRKKCLLWHFNGVLNSTWLNKLHRHSAEMKLVIQNAVLFMSDPTTQLEKNQQKKRVTGMETETKKNKRRRRRRRRRSRQRQEGFPVGVGGGGAWGKFFVGHPTRRPTCALNYLFLFFFFIS